MHIALIRFKLLLTLEGVLPELLMKKFNIFAIVYVITTRNEKKNVFDLKIFKKLLKFENVFFKEKYNILFVFK